jgi:hypothetical protein
MESAAFASIHAIPSQIRVVKDLLTYFKDIFPMTAQQKAAKERIEEIQKNLMPKVSIFRQ